jgi:hypothetical protein
LAPAARRFAGGFGARQSLLARASARQEWGKAWEVLYGALRSMFPGRQGYVEGFFTKFAKPVKAKKSTSGASGGGGAS